jgi:exosome complex RNA-binding protein Rrp42 (RNase PH superfamily)
MVNVSEYDYVIQGCHDDCRADGRTCLEFQTYAIVASSENVTALTDDSHYQPIDETHRHIPTQPILPLANGSARIYRTTSNGSYGGCLHMICAIKADLVRPSQHQPSRGVMELIADSLSSSNYGNTTSTSRKVPLLESVASVLQKLWVPYAVDYEALCLVPYQYVWRLQVDLYLLDGANSESVGSIVDAASHVMNAALRCTILPSITVESPFDSTDITNPPDWSDRPSDCHLIIDGDIRNGKPPSGVHNSPFVVTLSTLCSSDRIATPTKSTNRDTRLSNGAGTVLLVDANPIEASIADGSIHVSCQLPFSKDDFDTQGKICAIMQSGRRSIPNTLLPRAMQTALSAAHDAPRHYPLVRPHERNTLRNNNEELHLLQQEFVIRAKQDVLKTT